MHKIDIKIINRALGYVRDGLRNGEIPAELFNIYSGCTCIGGLAEMALVRAWYCKSDDLLRFADGEESDDQKRLHELFFEELHTKETPESAARAIDKYLDASEGVRA